MEDVKEPVLAMLLYFSLIFSFNPCFNGRCKRTLEEKKAKFEIAKVSILVLMEDVKEQK